jgi:hypothetical protein
MVTVYCKLQGGGVEKMIKISDQTMRMINQLPQETRTRVDQVIRRHIAACLKNGSPVENLDRILIEAVEVTKLEERLREEKVEEAPDWEPYRKYEQYSSPRDL